jgi:ubiquinone/menaquinone biosynthesis C-methylase UbiE
MRHALKSSGHPSRKEQVTVQYDSEEAAANYARAYGLSRREGQFFRSRLRLVQDALATCSGGNLLDAGCGPGIMARTLLESRPHDFRVAVLDQSIAMVQHCVAYVRDVGEVYAAAGDLQAMPFADDSFDVTLVMGVLEYTDARAAIREIARVTHPGGLVIATMLNPFSLYRLTEWFLYWPLIRVLGAAEGVLGVHPGQRHGARRSGIRALPAGSLRRLMRQVGLRSVDVVYFDVTPTVPPLDRLPMMVRRADRASHERTVTRGWRRWMGTGYAVIARTEKPASSARSMPDQESRSR